MCVLAYLDQTLLRIDVKNTEGSASAICRASTLLWDLGVMGSYQQVRRAWKIPIILSSLLQYCPFGFFFSLGCYLFKLFLLSVRAGQRFQGLCNINNIHACPQILVHFTGYLYNCKVCCSNNKLVVPYLMKVHIHRDL